MPKVLDSGVIIRPVPRDVGYVVSFRQTPCGIMTSLLVTMTSYPTMGNMHTHTHTHRHTYTHTHTHTNRHTHSLSCSIQYSTIQTVGAHLEYLLEQSSDPAAQTAAQTRIRH